MKKNTGKITPDTLREVLGDEFDGTPVEEIIKQVNIEKFLKPIFMAQKIGHPPYHYCIVPLCGVRNQMKGKPSSCLFSVFADPPLRPETKQKAGGRWGTNLIFFITSHNYYRIYLRNLLSFLSFLDP